MAAHTWEQVQKQIADNDLFFSDADLYYAQQDPDWGMEAVQFKMDFKNATTDDQRALANAGLNQSRSDRWGYTAGSDGSKFYLNPSSPQSYEYSQPKTPSGYTYQQTGQQSSFNDQTNIGTPTGAGAGAVGGGLFAPPDQGGQNATMQDAGKLNTNIGQYSDWKNPYQELTNAALDKVLNREEFVDPNEAALNNAYQNVMNQGPWENPYATDLENAYQNVMNQGPWENQYADQQQTLLNQILDQQEFSYDPAEDVAWQQAKKMYAREADRAQQDMLGQMAGLTGGMASTAAITAASQAGDYYRGQMMDRLPEYQQAAYQRWMDGLANDRSKLDILNSMSESDYAKFMDSVNMNYDKFNTANQMSEQDYGKFVDQLNQDLTQYGVAKEMSDSNYQKWVDALGFDADQLSILNTLGQQARDEFDTDRNFGYNQWTDELAFQTDKENTKQDREDQKEQQDYERAQYAKEYADSTNDGLAKFYLSLYDSTMDKKYLDLALERIGQIGK